MLLESETSADQISRHLRRFRETAEISQNPWCCDGSMSSHRGTTTRQAVANNNSVFGIQVATKRLYLRWFKKFCSGVFSLSNEPQGRPKTQVDNDVPKMTSRTPSRNRTSIR
ncbi:hypothetical protein NPIL_93731 [Nephila pilipes]|uniref:Uncharacterized protein n=1 Tax=Nephila pilipes TaxID=299642 RepID=A0A8X6UF32_NEPPI|nr:hypothetical protein NPIL_93731 [Nephila pilipes]